MFVEDLKKAMKRNPTTDSAPIVALVILNEGIYHNLNSIKVLAPMTGKLMQVRLLRKIERNLTSMRPWEETTQGLLYKLYLRSSQIHQQCSEPDWFLSTVGLMTIMLADLQ